MLFSEIYGNYYHVLTGILTRAVEGTLTQETLHAIIREQGFEESILTIPRNLRDGTWPLLREDLTTPLEHTPTRPLTDLEKRWMKSLLSDPRIRLFDPPAEGLEDVEPLCPAEAIVYYDRYGDGDPYEDPDYIRNFRTIVKALGEKRWLRVRFEGRRLDEHDWKCVPYKLEYSPKDDKFRLITGNKRVPLMINVARIRSCELLGPVAPGEYRPMEMRKRSLELELTDERNALERCMLHFSHLEKETWRIGENRYRLKLRYEQEDETELLIRVLSFGPMVKVIAPEEFRKKLVGRLKRQMGYGVE